MTFMDKVYTLRTEVRSNGETAYFISFTDGQDEFYDLAVSEPFYIEFRQMERRTVIYNNPISDTRKHQTCGTKRYIGLAEKVA